MMDLELKQENIQILFYVMILIHLVIETTTNISIILIGIFSRYATHLCIKLKIIYNINKKSPSFLGFFYSLILILTPLTVTSVSALISMYFVPSMISVLTRSVLSGFTLITTSGVLTSNCLTLIIFLGGTSEP